MIPSRRFLFLVSLGLIPAVMAVWLPGFFLVALLYFAGCSALMAGSYFFGVKPEQVSVSRHVSPRLSLGEPETVELKVSNYARVPVRLLVTDTVPGGWDVEGLPGEVSVRPGQEAVITYTVTPNARGRFQFGDIHVRLQQYPHLVVRQIRIAAGTEVRIYPDLREVARYEVMARRSRLEELGVHRSRLAGRGTEFERIRDYTPDDEYRQIDWKATARRSRPMTRVYEVERSQSVFIVLDAGRMMAGRVGKLAKLDYAI
ncbi:MAG: hypothetical protein K0Q72_4085, partial [Armatimonadetes bacterium]|nr:hypothetical protein [Armatimonadota bacterium]